MTSQERREARYQRRKAKRQQKKQERADNIGGIEAAMSYNELFQAGKKCCNGVRWKNSTQRFEMHLFSGTAVRCRQVRNGTWKPAPYVHFTLSERGKTRPIDAPRIQDRQVHKAFTKNVLLPLYLPDMIWNNGASLEDKGFEFSQKCLEADLRRHFRKYGKEGKVILIDFSKYFPTAPHREIYKRHDRILLDQRLKSFGNSIVASTKGDIGMPLGVEPSQAEMIALPSPLDNYLKCQLRLEGAGHYMDDYYVLVPPDRDAKALLDEIIRRAEAMGLHINRGKSQIRPLTKPFRYCKIKFYITDSGRIIRSGNRDGIKRARRKFRTFKTRIANHEMTYEDLWTSTNGILAYFGNYNNHTRVLKLRRLFFSLFGFSCENIWNFRHREWVENGVHRT